MMPLLRLLRPHQWTKNLLVFVSLLVGHQYGNPSLLWQTLLCFVAFCLVSSTGYIVNDWRDIADDRNHPEKCRRPLAAGEVAVSSALCLAVVLGLTGLMLAWMINGWVLVCVLCYLASTLLYSLWLKRKLLLDVIVLAGLYTIRILAGVAVLGSEPSFWLLAFAMFIFSSLAILKRYIELRERPAQGLQSFSRRAYTPEEQQILSVLGVANGSLAVLVLAFYMNSPQVQALYSTVLPLWLLCPLLMYWIGRIWLLASRSRVHGDPIFFALRDRTSYLTAVAAALLIWLAK
jgi:4-hydroxybenzoate polyprenyltransferase